MKNAKKALTLDQLKSAVNKTQVDGSLSKIVGGVMNACHVSSMRF